MHLEHCRGHVGSRFAVDQLVDNVRLLLAECDQDNIFGAANGLESHGNAHVRHVFNAAEVFGLHALGAVGKLLDMSVRVKKRGRLVKADMSVKADAENDKVKAAVGCYLIVVALGAFLGRVVELRDSLFGVKLLIELMSAA